MKIPFTIDEFLDVFRRYNEGVFPAQIIAYLLGIMAMVLLFKQSRNAGKVISGILALYWLWMGAVYHLFYFVTINPAAVIFGIVFLIQGILFLIFGVFQGKMTFSLSFSAIHLKQMVAIVLIVYAMLIYPVLNQFLGHLYPNSPVFGLAPCPTVIFTFGLLLLSDKRVPFYLLVIPFLWSLLGFSAAMHLGVIEDYGLVIAGLLGVVLILSDKGSKKFVHLTKDTDLSH